MNECGDEFKIAPMETRHLRGVLEIERSSFTTPWSKQAFYGELTYNEFAHYYICLAGKKVVGYCGMWIILDEAHVTNLAVHPLWRGRKLGALLLQTLMEQGLVLGADRITLEVRVSNALAQQLYRGMGFNSVGLRRGYYTDTNEDAIIMWRNLREVLTCQQEGG